jgi:hypothetical protein
MNEITSSKWIKEGDRAVSKSLTFWLVSANMIQPFIVYISLSNEKLYAPIQQTKPIIGKVIRPIID